MGASKKDQMKFLQEDWADQIFKAVQAKNDGKGAAWLLPVAALALTGARPAALEKGIVFSVEKEDGKLLVQAVVPGTKQIHKEGKLYRGQPEYVLRFSLDSERHEEIVAIALALKNSPDKKIVVQYDAEAISTRLRELSKTLWPRKKYHVSAYSYRELFSSRAKGSGMEPEEIAAAMGHLSTESQGKYSPRSRKLTSGGAVAPARPCKSAKAPEAIKSHRSPMTRFKIATKLKKIASPS